MAHSRPGFLTQQGLSSLRWVGNDGDVCVNQEIAGYFYGGVIPELCLNPRQGALTKNYHMKPIVTLRYFNCRGRAQVFRYLLTERGIAFTDERVPFNDNWQAWGKLKQDPAKSGLFNRLPILHWGEDTIAETWVISHYLHQKLDARELTDKENRLVLMLQSSILEDMGLIYTLLNLDLGYKGADFLDTSQNTITSLTANFEKYQNFLNSSKYPFLVTQSPTIADYWLYETLTSCRLVFKPVNDLIFRRLPDLSEFLREMEERPGMKTAAQALPECLTARPDHHNRLSELHSLLRDL
jgi:glutathione S-transferase